MVEMSYTEVINDIEHLPHYREFTCRKCGKRQEVFVLLIQAKCENCGTITKLRGYASIGSETEDVIDAALKWLGKDKEFDLAMERKKLIDLESE
jgi:hypothetical protein